MFYIKPTSEDTVRWREGSRAGGELKAEEPQSGKFSGFLFCLRHLRAEEVCNREMPSGCSQRKSKPSPALSRQRTWKGAGLQYRNFWLITFLSPGRHLQSTLWSHPHACTPTKSLLSCLTLSDPMGCSPPGSSVHGDSPGKNTGVGCHVLLQGIFLTQGSNRVPYISCIGRWILYHLSHQVSLPAQQQRLNGERTAPSLSAGHGDAPPPPNKVVLGKAK